MMKFYQVSELRAGQWGFTTPTGSLDGCSGRAVAERLAAITERQDREQARTGTGPIAAILRSHFEAEAAGKEFSL